MLGGRLSARPLAIITPFRAVIVVLMAGTVGLAIWVVLILSDRDVHVAYSNLYPEGSYVAALSAGQRHCQLEALLPNDANRVRLLAGAYGRPGPALAISARRGATRVLSGALPAGWREPMPAIPIVAPRQVKQGVQLCIVNRGPGPVALGGFAGRVRLEYLRFAPESWWQLAGRIDRRFALGKPRFVGRWTLPFVGALVLLALLAAGGSVALVARERSEQ